jgi:hypothetical protein
VATVAGDISVAWKKAGDHFTLKLTVPEVTQASIYLPSEDLKSVKINGKPLAEMPEIKSGIEVGSGVVLEVGPGKYRFECETGRN